MTLTEFLTARLDEDYETAFGGAPSPWREGDWDGEHGGAREVLDRSGSVTAHAYYGGTYGHVMRFDPARVLAEVEAKRQIVALHEPVDDEPDGFCLHCDCDSWPCGTIAALALPYADHPDYREEWKP